MSTSRNNTEGIENTRQLKNYKYGDLVWAKLTSYPWWPAQIYHEALVKASVLKGKKEGDVLVSFFGDSTYRWFRNPDALIPFEENFHVKSQETHTLDFQKVVNGAIRELSWMMGLGSACQCRKRFIFPHPNVTGVVMADGNDGKLWPCANNQIKQARDFFQPKDLFSFIREQALAPMNNNGKTLESVKHKAIVLEFRKALYVECDEKYKQAFEPVSDRSLHAMSQTVVNPSKVSFGATTTSPLSVQEPVLPQALDRKRSSLKSTKKKEKLHVEIRAGKSEETKRSLVDLSSTSVASIQNKRPKKDLSIRVVKPVCTLYDTAPTTGNLTKAPSSGLQRVLPQILDKAKASLEPTKTKGNLHLESKAVKSKGTKSPVMDVELSRRNVMHVQYKRQVEDLSMRDEKPVRSLHATTLTIATPSKARLSSQKLVIAQAFDGAKPSSKPTKSKEKSTIESGAGRSKVTKRSIVELSGMDVVPAQNKMPKQDVSTRGAKPVAATKVLKPAVSKPKCIAPKSPISEYGSVGAPQPTLRISQPPLPLKSCLKRLACTRINLPNNVLVSSSTATRARTKKLKSSSPAARARPVQFPSFSYSSNEQQHRASSNANPDISQQMIVLLLKCSHVVRNVTMALGYTPYHPL